MKLYVDDVRRAPAGWTAARTVDEALRLLKTQRVEEVSLDYMIGNSLENNFSPVAKMIASLPEKERPKKEEKKPEKEAEKKPAAKKEKPKKAKK